MADTTNPAAPSSHPVMRVARRRAKPGCAPAYEALVRAMLADVQTFPGAMGAELIPPTDPGGEYQVVLTFDTQAHLDGWNHSEKRRLWHERLAAVADGDPEYQVLTGLEAWFVRPPIGGHKPPKRWKMTFVTWCGIFPTVAVLMYFVEPQVRKIIPWFVPKTAVMTAMIVVVATYVMMPQLVRLFRPWLSNDD